MKIIVTGDKGFIGSRVKKVLSENHEVYGLCRTDADISDYMAVEKYMKSIAPDVVVHCAALGNVDKSEEDNELAYRVNVIGTANVATCCANLGVAMISSSSDQVYDYIPGGIFHEYMDTLPNNYYGFTKVEGEKLVKQIVPKHHILRLGWQYDRFLDGDEYTSHGIMKAVADALNDNEPINCTSRSYQNVTYIYDTVDAIVAMVEGKLPYGIYNITSENPMNLYDTFVYIMDKMGVPKEQINKLVIENKEFKAKDLRADPFNLKMAGYIMPSFVEGLGKCLEL